MKKKRRQYSPEEKVTILKRHLVDKVPVSDLCDEYSLQPTVFYRWQKQFFEMGSSAFEKSQTRQEQKKDRRIKELEDKLQLKNEVLSELLEEHIKLKKVLGNFDRRLDSPRYPRCGC